LGILTAALGFWACACSCVSVLSCSDIADPPTHTFLMNFPRLHESAGHLTVLHEAG
jgi:hypothetical protein